MRADVEVAADALHPEVRWYRAGDPDGENSCHNREEAAAFTRA